MDYFEALIRHLLCPSNLTLVPDFFGKTGLYILVIGVLLGALTSSKDLQGKVTLP